MKVEEIPSDEVLEMTKSLHRAFNTTGCNPMCHCCMTMIPIGAKFKLASVGKKHFKNSPSYSSGASFLEVSYIKTTDVMLCDACTAQDFVYMQTKMEKESKAEFDRRQKLHQENGGGCFRVNGKIIH